MTLRIKFNILSVHGENTAIMSLILLQFLLGACAQIQSRYHTVVAGESLSTLAKKYDVSERHLRVANSGHFQGGLLATGTKLYVPFESNPKWHKALELPSVQRVKYSVNDTPTNYSEIPFFIWPVNGYISSGFGVRRGNMHDGVDIVAPEGTPIKAARSGHVIYAHNRIGGYGNMIIVRHPDSYSTVYAHLSRMEVRKGMFVSKGQVIGRVGQTGHAEGPHLHFEVRNNRSPVNPLLYLQVRVAANILRR